MSNLRGLQKSKNLRSIRFCRFDSFNALKGMTRITWSAFYSSVSFREPTQSDQIRINLSYGSVRPSPGFYHGSITEIYFQISLRNMSHSPRFITLQNSFFEIFWRNILGTETKPTKKSNENWRFLLIEFDSQECQFWQWCSNGSIDKLESNLWIK